MLPAFNGDKQFNQWSGHASGLTLAQVQADMLGTLNQPGGVVWHLADQTEALVGVAKTALLPSPGTAWIDLLIIRRAFQGRGYGSEAASLLETHLFSFPGIRQIALAVLVENTPAMAFWEKRGYVRGGRYLDNEGDDVYAYLLSRSFASLEEDVLVTNACTDRSNLGFVLGNKVLVAQMFAKNGFLVLCSVTREEQTSEVNADQIFQGNRGDDSCKIEHPLLDTLM